MHESPEGGIWYHPKSLWSAAYSGLAISSLLDPVRFVFDRKDFRNGTRWPIQLNRIAMCGINYPFARVPEEGLTEPAGRTPLVDNSLGGVFSEARIRISAPFRKSYSRFEIPLASYTPKATGQPSTRDNSVAPNFENSQSSLFGQTYLEFDKPLYLPRMASIEWALSSVAAMRWGGDAFGAGSFTLPVFDTPLVTLAWLEKGGLFSGSARIRTFQTGSNNDLVQADFPTDDEPIPYPRPPNWTPAIEPGGYVPSPFWAPQTVFSSQAYNQQESTRDGSTHTYGMSALVNQIEYDDALFTILDGQGVPSESYQIAPYSTAIGNRVRITNGPTNDDWWRPGAPLALVLDTITPATVYELPEPIVLGPGESLEVELQIPGDATGGEGYNVGISFNGFVAIEG